MTTRSTDALIDALVADVRPLPPRALGRRLALALTAGCVLALALVLGLLGPRPDLMQAMHGGMFWTKAAYTLALAVVAGAMTIRLARPERRALGALWWIALPVAVVAALAAWEIAATPASARMGLWLGHSWRWCPLLVLGLSLPIIASLLYAFRAFAPTRLRLAGAMAGLTAGAAAATLYGIACDEASAMFLLTWYSLGIAGVGVLGALVGPRVLRW